jgi:uncharacterized OB-fold protein
MPDSTPLPLPTVAWVSSPELEPHRAGLEAGELRLPRCEACREVIWFPRAFCPKCGSTSVTWFTAEGTGTVYSFSIVSKGLGSFAEASPYAVAYVGLHEGPRVLTNIVGSLDGLEIGADVIAVVDGGEAPTLRFRLAGAVGESIEGAA